MTATSLAVSVMRSPELVVAEDGDVHSSAAKPGDKFQPGHLRHVLVEDQARGPPCEVFEKCGR